RIDFDDVSGGGSQELPPYLQCVPYARQVSGIAIFGDAWTWWDQAAGRYERGFRPKVGAVMAFKPHGNMRLGHVAAVSRIVDSGTVLARATKRGQDSRVQLAALSRPYAVTRLGLEARVGGGYSARSVTVTASADPIGEIIASRLRRPEMALR